MTAVPATVVPLTAVAKPTSRELVLPDSWEETRATAEVLVRSGFFKDTTSISQGIAKILAGRELGLSPISSMTGIYIIEGKVSLSANLMGALVRNSKRYDYEAAKLSDDVCDLVFYRLSENQRVELGHSVFTKEDAQRASTKNMAKFPRNMLFARAMSNGVKWFCPDVTNFPAYTPEEMGADVNEDGNPIQVSANGHSQETVQRAVQEQAERAAVVEGSYTEDQIGPSFDGEHSEPVSSFTTDEGQNPAPKPAEPKPVKVEQVTGEEYVRDGLIYRDFAGGTRVKFWGPKVNEDKSVIWLKGWFPPDEVSGKNLDDLMVEKMLSLFPGKDRPNQYEALNHLKKHFKKATWRALTWKELAACYEHKKHGVVIPPYYVEEPEKASVVKKAAEPAVDPSVSKIVKMYNLAETEVPKDQVEVFIAAMLRLPDPGVLKVLVDKGLRANNPAHFQSFLDLAELLSAGTFDTESQDFRDMVEYAVENAGANAG